MGHRATLFYQHHDSVYLSCSCSPNFSLEVNSPDTFGLFLRLQHKSFKAVRKHLVHQCGQTDESERANCNEKNPETL